MAAASDYMPAHKPGPVVVEYPFDVGVIGLEHGHIYSMCEGLVEAGARLKWVFDPDGEKVSRFLDKFANVLPARDEAEVLGDDDVRLVAAAAIPSDRCALGMRAMNAGKDYFTDKAPFTSFEQLAEAERRCAETGLKYAVYYAERIHSECALHAGILIAQGAIGRVIQVLGVGPHRLNPAQRPDWFFRIEKYGGILCDIGSHQVEQFLHFAGAFDAEVQLSRVANYHHKHYPKFQDFGDATLLADNGATGYIRVDWFTPDGLTTWGDGRTLVLGTDGYIELRKYTDIAREASANHVYLVNVDGEFHLHVDGLVGHPFFGELILDCLNRTENAMTQAHAFKAAELCLRAQRQAVRIE